MADSEYDEIGGREAVEAVVEDFYALVLDDDRLAEYFEGYDMEKLYAHQVQFISAVADGPVQYSGADMREAHAHMDIGQSDFDAVAAYLERALSRNGVSPEHIAVLLDEVAALEDPILGRE